MSTILTTKSEKDYELLDSGEGEKLERYGKYVLRRPDPQSLWKPQLDEKEWAKADAVFVRDGREGRWQTKVELPERWQAEIGGIKFLIRPTAFKHTGVFPEQASNWEWLRTYCHSERSGAKLRNPLSILNLFGYTGGATLVCAQAGAEVCHVDGSKTAIGWARDNATLNGLEKAPVRWILDDAVKFVEREVKREHKYDGIILDPPAFGHGPTGEMWRIEKDFMYLVDLCEKVLSDKPLFVLVNGYASGYSAIAYENNLLPLLNKFGGKIEKGELTIAESGKNGRLLPCGIFARWSR
ncbi:MAG: class I SAM-dependent methyltransferase [Candidatus Magasanikbacteria bacterium]